VVGTGLLAGQPFSTLGIPIPTKWEKKEGRGCRWCCSCCLLLLLLPLLLLLVVPVPVLPPLLLLLMGLHDNHPPLSLLPSSWPHGSTTAAVAAVCCCYCCSCWGCVYTHLPIYACLLSFSLPLLLCPHGPSHCYCGHCCWCCHHCQCCSCCSHCSCLGCVYAHPPHMCVLTLVLPHFWCPFALIIVLSPGLCLYQIHVSKCIVVILLTFKGCIIHLK
jgi:hypothetical protein